MGRARSLCQYGRCGDNADGDPNEGTQRGDPREVNADVHSVWRFERIGSRAPRPELDRLRRFRLTQRRRTWVDAERRCHLADQAAKLRLSWFGGLWFSGLGFGGLGFNSAGRQRIT